MGTDVELRVIRATVFKRADKHTMETPIDLSAKVRVIDGFDSEEYIPGLKCKVKDMPVAGGPGSPEALCTVRHNPPVAGETPVIPEKTKEVEKTVRNTPPAANMPIKGCWGGPWGQPPQPILPKEGDIL